MIAKLVIKFIRRDVPICPCHGSKHKEGMRQYARRGRTLYYKCRQDGCEFKAKTVLMIV